MLRELIIYPNKRLFVKSKEVEKFDHTLHTLLDDMYETMIANLGIGLAAIQVNEALRVIIIELPIDEDDPDAPPPLRYELINPKYEALSDEKDINNEGCLSVPGFFEDISRFKRIKLCFQDRFGKAHELEADGFLAVAIQHECDHLDGHLFIERLSFLKRKKFDKDFKKNSKKRL